MTLPEGFGRRQSGVLTWGGHDDEFYNADTTVVISAFASYYDAPNKAPLKICLFRIIGYL